MSSHAMGLCNDGLGWEPHASRTKSGKGSAKVTQDGSRVTRLDLSNLH